MLICGAESLGLSLSLALGQLAIKNMFTEKHSWITIHSKAQGVNVCTMELFRHWWINQHYDRTNYQQKRVEEKVIGEGKVIVV